MVRFIVTAPLPDQVRTLLPSGDLVEFPGPDPAPRPALVEAMSGAEGLLCTLVDRVDHDLLSAAPLLRVVSQLAVGVDNIDVPACTRRAIPVGHTPDVLTDTTADTALAILLSVIRRLPEGQALVRAGEWERWSLDLLSGEDLHGSTVGIVGLGRIGAAIARRLTGFGVQMLYSAPRRKPSLEAHLRIGYRSLEGLLAESDHVILCAPLNASTRGIIDASALARMKPTATLINIARGPLVDHEALADALASGQLGRAGLDVTDPEPIPADHRLVSMPNCLIVPHIGSASTGTRIKMATRAIENLRAGLEGARLRWCVNPEVYDP
ncbi:MAG: 2-hydroxyacid dehydrogenase [Acidimicrobiia bacterium]